MREHVLENFLEILKEHHLKFPLLNVALEIISRDKFCLRILVIEGVEICQNVPTMRASTSWTRYRSEFVQRRTKIDFNYLIQNEL